MRRSAARLAALAAGLAACGQVPAPRHCATSADCAADARCLDEVCVADAPPVAVITSPASLLSNVSYVFGSSGSYDPDAGDSVVTHQWTASAAQAPCSPSPDAAATESLAVVFPCAGSFDVKLVVVDQLGVPSAPRVVRVSVAQSVDPPAVAVGADLVMDHRCAGDPLVCTPLDGAQGTTFSLSAAGSSPAAGGFTYRWSYRLPPELSGKPGPSVAFSPDEASPAPVVAVQTQGTAIAGAWEFVVEVTDSRGLVAVGTQRVVIGNRPPDVQGAGPALIQVPHLFSPSAPGASTGTMVALGATPALVVTDPDGDPFEATFGHAHSGDGANAFLVQGLADHATFSVMVLYGGPADAAYLIGPGVSRTITFAAVDANGAIGSASWEIEVTNRPPRVVAPVTALEVPHTFDAGRSRYLAVAALSAFADDDGDPLWIDAATGDPICAGQQLEPTTLAAEVECAVPYAGVPAANAIAGLHAVTATARDPWAGTPATTNVTIGNRAPRLTSGTMTLSPSCSTGTCCLVDPDTKVCQDYYMTQGVAAATIQPPLSDDDGDPMLLTYAAQGSCATISPSSDVCVPGSCSVDLSLCGHVRACGATATSGIISTVATDGDLSLATSFTAAASCG